MRKKKETTGATPKYKAPKKTKNPPSKKGNKPRKRSGR